MPSSGIIVGTGPNGTPIPIAVDGKGRIVPDDKTDVELFREMLLELRAIRLGMEIENGLEPEDLIKMIVETKTGDIS